MDFVSNRLIFGPKCKTFGGGKQLMKIDRSLKKKEVEWRLVSHYAGNMNFAEEEKSSQAQREWS